MNNNTAAASPVVGDLVNYLTNVNGAARWVPGVVKAVSTTAGPNGRAVTIETGADRGEIVVTDHPDFLKTVGPAAHILESRRAEILATFIRRNAALPAYLR